MPYPGTTRFKSENVDRDLAPNSNEIWDEFRHKVRKNVATARRNGVQIEIDGDGRRLSDFVRIYTDTMTRRQAAESYFFDESFFRRLNRNLPGQFVYFHAICDDRVVSTELVLVSETRTYSFLGGTMPEAYGVRPNDLLKLKVIHWSRLQGKSSFVLGGGFSPDDGTFRYKKSFAPHGVFPFHVGERILDEERYESLVAARVRCASNQFAEWTPCSAYFPAYRG